MLIGAVALAGVSIFYFVKYVVLAIALQNSGVVADLQHSIRALWLAFACQGILIALLYAVVSVKPHAVSREVIVLLGLLHLVESVLQFAFAGSTIAAALLIVTALFVLLGSALWPRPTSPPPYAGAGT
jgi:hypothetical protein